MENNYKVNMDIFAYQSEEKKKKQFSPYKSMHLRRFETWYSSKMDGCIRNGIYIRIFLMRDTIKSSNLIVYHYICHNDGKLRPPCHCCAIQNMEMCIIFN